LNASVVVAARAMPGTIHTHMGMCQAAPPPPHGDRPCPSPDAELRVPRTSPTSPASTSCASDVTMTRSPKPPRPAAARGAPIRRRGTP